MENTQTVSGLVDNVSSGLLLEIREFISSATPMVETKHSDIDQMTCLSDLLKITDHIYTL